MAPPFNFTWNNLSDLTKPPSTYRLFTEAQRMGDYPWVHLTWKHVLSVDSVYWKSVETGIKQAFHEAKVAARSRGLNYATVHWKAPAYTNASATSQHLPASSTIPSNTASSSQSRPAKGRGADHYRERPAPLRKRKVSRRALPAPSVSAPYPDITVNPYPVTSQNSHQSETQREYPLPSGSQPQVSAQPPPSATPLFLDHTLPNSTYSQWRADYGATSNPPVLYSPSEAQTAYDWYNTVYEEFPGANNENFFLNLNGQEYAQLVAKEAIEEEDRRMIDQVFSTWDFNVDPAL
ncbi:hypothetical protein CPB85DRAFT_1503365 [Mucidula mucida]|nr:hypothetical protein CPB85DRAFT_1503365 [Mucidula mucida]